MKEKILQYLYKLTPFNLNGDLISNLQNNIQIPFSCLIICGKNCAKDLENILWTLSAQTLEKTEFEVIILNDGGGDDIDCTINKHKNNLNIKTIKNKAPCRFLGKNRNKTIQHSSGKYLLFLDDDTRIIQKTFLANALQILKNKNPEVILPKAHPTYSIVKNKCNYLDDFSFATRCCLYSRKIVEEIKGFNNSMTAFEDHEMAIRILITGAKIIKSDKISYYHPPIYMDTMRKPFSFGQSIMRLKKHYPFAIWIVIYLNTLRYLFYIFIPTQKNMQWFKLSLGVLIAPFLKKKLYYY